MGRLRELAFTPRGWPLEGDEMSADGHRFVSYTMHVSLAGDAQATPVLHMRLMAPRGVHELRTDSDDEGGVAPGLEGQQGAEGAGNGGDGGAAECAGGTSEGPGGRQTPWSYQPGPRAVELGAPESLPKLVLQEMLGTARLLERVAEYEL